MIETECNKYEASMDERSEGESYHPAGMSSKHSGAQFVIKLKKEHAEVPSNIAKGCKFIGYFQLSAPKAGAWVPQESMIPQDIQIEWAEFHLTGFTPFMREHVSLRSRTSEEAKTFYEGDFPVCLDTRVEDPEGILARFMIGVPENIWPGRVGVASYDLRVTLTLKSKEETSRRVMSGNCALHVVNYDTVASM